MSERQGEGEREIERAREREREGASEREREIKWTHACKSGFKSGGGPTSSSSEVEHSQCFGISSASTDCR